MPRDESVDERTLMPDWYAREKRLAHMLPYVSLVDDNTVRTRVNELFQCIRLSGVNSYTTDDAYLDKVTALFARIIAQLGPEFSYYVHKVSKSITPDLLPVQGDDFAGAVDEAWRGKLEGAGLRDKTLTLTVIHRPPPKSFLGFINRSAPERFKEETRKRVRRLKEAVGVFTSGLAELKPRVLSAASGELVGFLGALNTGRELPLYPANRYGFLAYNVANTRVTFFEDHFELSEGVVGHRYGKSFTIGEYAEGTNCTMFDMLNLPVDMIVTHSFTPINSNLMAGRIKRQKRQMQASQDAALSLLEALDIAHDDLEAKRQSFGEHHMVITVFCDSLDELQCLGAEIVNAAAAEGVQKRFLGPNVLSRDRDKIVLSLPRNQTITLHQTQPGEEEGLKAIVLETSDLAATQAFLSSSEISFAASDDQPTLSVSREEACGVTLRFTSA